MVPCVRCASPQVGYLRIDFLYAASSVIAKKIDQISARSCVLLLDAFAIHRFIPERAVTAICDVLEKSNEFDTLTPSELASVLSSLARLNLRPDKLLKQVCSQLLILWKTTEVAAVSPNVFPEPEEQRNRNFSGSAGQAGSLRQRRYNSHDVAQALYGLTKLRWHAPKLMRLLVGTALPSVITRMHSHQLSLAAVALHRTRQSRDLCRGNSSEVVESGVGATVPKNGEEELLERRAFELLISETSKRLPQFTFEVSHEEGTGRGKTWTRSCS